MEVMNIVVAARDVIINILSRLPPRSVIQYKLVCKAWNAIVEDPYFAEIHTGKQLSSSSDPAAAVACSSSSGSSNSISFLLVGTLPFEGRKEHHSKLYIEDLIYDDDDVSKPSSFYTNLITPVNRTAPILDDDLEIKRLSTRVIGTCNGLVCLRRDSGHIVVYNPLTQEYAKIVPSVDMTRSASTSRYLDGFGYHPATNEFKIFRIVYRLFGGDIPVDAKAHVYTLGSEKWRSREAEIKHIIWGTGLHFDGSVYWLCGRNTEGVHIISYFDLGDEELRMMSGPQATAVAAGNSKYSSKLTLLEWNLCVIEGVLSHEMNVWVMKRGEGNNGYSWTKDFIIPDHSLLHDYKANPTLLTKGGKIMALVCMDDGTRFIYSFDTKRANTLRSLPTIVETYSGDRRQWVAVLFMRSNVSLKALGELEVLTPEASAAEKQAAVSWLNPILCGFRCWLSR